MAASHKGRPVVEGIPSKMAENAGTPQLGTRGYQQKSLKTPGGTTEKPEPSRKKQERMTEKPEPSLKMAGRMPEKAGTYAGNDTGN